MRRSTAWRFSGMNQQAVVTRCLSCTTAMVRKSRLIWLFNECDLLCCFAVMGCGPTPDLSCTIHSLAEHTQYEISVETVVEYTADSSCVSKVNSSLQSFWTGLSPSSGTFNQLFLRILFYSCHVVSSDFVNLTPRDISLSTLTKWIIWASVNKDQSSWLQSMSTEKEIRGVIHEIGCLKHPQHSNFVIIFRVFVACLFSN